MAKNQNGFKAKETKSDVTDLTRRVIGINQPEEPEQYLFLKYEYTQRKKGGKYGRRPYTLIPIDKIIEKGKQRTIALVEGESTIYVDEMSEQGKKITNRVSDARFVPMKFYDGDMYVNKGDLLKLEFLTKSNYNASNPNRDKSKNMLFKLYAPEREAIKAMQDDELLTEAKYYVHENMKTEDGQNRLVQYAEVIGITTSGRTLGEIKYDLMARAQASPDKFLKGLKDPNNKTKSIVLEAIKVGILVKIENRLQWAESNTDLVVAQIGQDPVDVLVAKGQGEFKETIAHIESLVMQTEPVV